MISVANRFRWDKDEGKLQSYVLGWLALLTIFLAVAPGSGFFAIVVVVLASYRLQDLVFGTLDDALDLTPRGLGFSEFSPVTPILIALVNVVQVILIFAIGYVVLAGDPSAFKEAHISSRLDYFFLSWTSLGSLGNGYTAESSVARILIMAEAATGLLIIVVAISRFLGRPSARKGHGQTIADDPSADGR